MRNRTNSIDTTRNDSESLAGLLSAVVDLDETLGVGNGDVAIDAIWTGARETTASLCVIVMTGGSRCAGLGFVAGAALLSGSLGDGVIGVSRYFIGSSARMFRIVVVHSVGV